MSTPHETTANEEQRDAQRWWSPTRGMGTLTWGKTPHRPMRWKPESGPEIEWQSREIGIGMKGRKRPRRKADRAEGRHWAYFVTMDGETMIFRRNGPPLSTST